MWWLLAVVWAAFIFWLSSSPDSQGGFWLIQMIPFGDKVAHGVAFGILAFCLYMATRNTWFALFVTSLYGLFDEIHQMFTPGRSVDMTDWIADTLGALTVLGLVSFLTRGKINKSL
jgi:VanZ family protein